MPIPPRTRITQKAHQTARRALHEAFRIAHGDPRTTARGSAPLTTPDATKLSHPVVSVAFMQRLVLTAFGRPARIALETLVADAKGDDPLAPVTVAVPSNYAGLSLRRHGARFGAEPHARARQRAVPGAQPRRRAARRALPRRARSGSAHARGTPRSGTRRAGRSAGRVRTRRVTPVDRAGAGRRVPRPARRRRRRRSNGSHSDEPARRVGGPLLPPVPRAHRPTPTTTRTSSRSRRASSARSGIPADLGALVLFCPDRLSPGALALVAGFASRTFTAAVLGLTGDADADAETRAAGRDAGATPRRAATTPDPSAPRLGDRVISAPDPESEVREVVRALVERADAGRSLHDVAVAWRIAEPHARLLHERLGEAGIPVYGPSVRRLSDTVTGRTLMALLDLADRDFRRDDVMAFLAGARDPRDAGWSDGRRRPLGPDLARCRRRRRRRPVARPARARTASSGSITRMAIRDPEWLEVGPREDRPLRTQFVEELVALTIRGVPRPGRTGARGPPGSSTRYIGEPPASWPEAEIDAHHRLLDRLAALGALQSRHPGRPVDVPGCARRAARAVDRPRRPVRRSACCSARSAHCAGTDFDTVFVVGAAEGPHAPAAARRPAAPRPRACGHRRPGPTAVDRRGS